MILAKLTLRVNKEIEQLKQKVLEMEEKLRNRRILEKQREYDDFTHTFDRIATKKLDKGKKSERCLTKTKSYMDVSTKQKKPKGLKTKLTKKMKESKRKSLPGCSVKSLKKCTTTHRLPLNSDISEYSGDWEEIEKNNEIVGKEYLEIQKPVVKSSKLTTRTWFEDKENDRNFNGQVKPSKNKTNKYKQKYLAWKAENAEMQERILQLEAEKEKWRTRYKGLKHDYKRVFKRLDLVLK